MLFMLSNWCRQWIVRCNNSEMSYPLKNVVELSRLLSVYIAKPIS